MSVRIAAADLGAQDDRHVRELCIPMGWKAERVFDGPTSIYVLRGAASEVDPGVFSQVEIHVEPVGLSNYLVTMYACVRDAEGNDIHRPEPDRTYEDVAPGELQRVVRECWEGKWI